MRRPSVFVRKEAKGHGTRKRVEGGDVAGRHVVLVEDLVTTGSSSLAAMEALREEGAIVADCLAIISYEFPEARVMFERAGIRLHTTTTFETVLGLALEQGSIDDEGAVLMQDWLREPQGWARRRGLEASG
jgi:orotate phosphoribosyltransferase